jgi:hypothetical protein
VTIMKRCDVDIEKSLPMHFWDVARVDKRERVVRKRRDDFDNIVE